MRSGTGLSELTELLPMIEPPDGMCGSTAFVRWKKADRLVASVKSHSSSGISSIVWCDIWNAALLTRTSTLPNSSTAFEMIDRQCAGSLTSPATRTALRPAFSTQDAVSLASSCSSR
jgi:hypothetical protein